MSPTPAPPAGEWIEEGLIYRGPEPPAPGGPEWVEIPHEHYIPIARSRLIDALAGLPRAAAAPGPFRQAADILEGLVHFHYRRAIGELKDDYEYFSPLAGAKLRQGVPEEELARREVRFLANFLQLMIRGNFEPLREAEYRRATEHAYLFDLPVEVRWEAHDPELLTRFYALARSPEGAWIGRKLGTEGPIEEHLDLPPEVAPNALVFHRGVGIDRTPGWFLFEKIDLLIAAFFGALTYPLRRLLEGRRSDPAPAPGAAAGERTTGFERRWLRRVNLRSDLSPGALFRATRLQEPTLGLVVVLFRLKGGPAGGPEGGRTIHVKLFRDVPMADAEIVFPARRIRMRPYDLTMMAVFAVAGLATLLEAVRTQGRKGLIFAVLAAIGAYLYRIWSSYRRLRFDYEARMTSDLYHKNLDNALGVVQYLADSLEEQDLKEALLAYALLREAGRPLSARELDAAAERFLADRFAGVEVDFEVDDAIARVVARPGAKDGAFSVPIVRELRDAGGEVRYEACPLDEALAILDRTWDGLYRFGDPSEIPSPPRSGGEG